MFEEDRLYINIHDNQGTGWALGRIGTVEQWRELAMDWADSDGNEETYDTLRDLRKDEVTEYVSDVWDICIKDIRELTHEEFDDLKDIMHTM